MYALHDTQSQGTSNTYADHKPSRPDNYLILETLARIPSKVPNSIEAMKREWQRNRKLGCYFGQHRPARKSSYQTRAVKMQS